MKTSRPLVSIGVPTYNRARGLRRAVESVLSQDFSDLEIVISDNASTDSTPATCADLARRDARVEWVRQPVNRGATANFAATLQAAHGKYFMWLSDDDWLHPSYVRECVTFLEHQPRYSLVSGRSKFMQGDECIVTEPPLNLKQESGWNRVLAYYLRVGYNSIYYGMARTSHVQQIPLQHTLAGDWLFVASLALMGKVATLESVCLNRSFGGMSRTMRHLASSYGLCEFWMRNPYLAIAKNIFSDIAYLSPIFRRIGLPRRLLLATLTSVGVYAKFGLASPVWRVLKGGATRPHRRF